MKKAGFIFIMGMILAFSAGAQELKCRVEINSDQIQGTNKQVFSTLKDAIMEFLNNRKWTNAQFAVNERIECTLIITIKDVPETDRYSAEIQVQSRRPVYNSSYSTTLFNFKDSKFEFTYQEFEPLNFTDQTFDSNLTAVLAFYAYMIIGIDFDSFSPEGGEPYFTMAENIVNLAQSSMETGWKAFEDDRNRHALVTAFTEPRTAAFHQLWYDYHRKGLDEMALSTDKGRSKITASIESLKEIRESSPTTILLPLFKDSKLDEVINVYSKAPMQEKEEIYKILIRLYPTDGSRLEEIRKENR